MAAVMAGARAAGGHHKHHHHPHPPARSRAAAGETRRAHPHDGIHAAARSVRSPDITPEEEAEGRVADCAGQVLSLALVGVSLVPESLYQLTELQHLDLAGNRLAKLPPNLAKLPGLLSLNLEGNALESLAGVGKLASLTALNARSNRLTELSEELCELSSLLSLDVGDNALKSLPESLRSLSTLEFLRADSNKLDGISDTVLELGGLRNLSLGRNKIASVPQGIARLEKLMCLDIADNSVGVLPTEIAEMAELVQIDLSGNPMRCPPQEVCEEGALAIRGFLEDLTTGTSTCSSLDVVFLGCPGAGQAAVVSALFDDGKTRAETSTNEMNGPRVETWPLGRIDVDGVGPVHEATFRTWCFPGDEVSHEAYQMLLHRRCLFVVVIDIPAWTAGNHDLLVQRWVRDIRSRVPDAKILFVGNGLLTDAEESETGAELQLMVQQYESHRQNALQTQLEQLRSIIDGREQARKANSQDSVRARGWRAMKTMVATTAKRNVEQVTRIEKQLSTQLQFLNSSRPLFVSATSGKGIEELKAVLTDCLSRFLHFGAVVPQKYIQLQRHFEETQAIDVQAGWDSQDAESLAIYWNDFKVQCGRVGISGIEPVRRVAKYLTLVGTIVYVSEDAALKPFVFVDPIRLCEAFTYIAQQEGALALASDISVPAAVVDEVVQDGLEKLRSEGALNAAVRREIGARLHLPDHISQVVLSMMARVGMLVERPSESESSSAGGASAGMLAALSALAAPDMMVPSLLPEFPAPNLVSVWAGSWSSGWPNISISADQRTAAATTGEMPLNLQLQRVYVQCERTLTGASEGVTTPISIFGCTLSRLMQRVAAEPCIFWQHGACMAVQHELGVKGARVLVEQRGGGTVDSGQQPMLTVTIRSTTQALIDGSLAELWGRIDDCVRSAAEQQPGTILASYVACPFCQAKGKSPFLFTTTEISEAWRDGERMLLSPGIGKVPLELLQPPSFAEAVDADAMSTRHKRVERVTKQLESHLYERFLEVDAAVTQTPSNKTANSTASASGESDGYTDEQREELQEKREAQKGKYAIRMGFFRSDAKAALSRAGNPTTLLEFQRLVPKVLNRCHIPEREAEAMLASIAAKQNRLAVIEMQKNAEEDEEEQEVQGVEDADLDLSEDEEAEDDTSAEEILQRFTKAQESVGRQSNHGMTAVQLARLRARRNNTDFNVMRYMQFVDPENEGAVEGSALVPPGASQNAARDRPTVAWSNTGRSRAGTSASQPSASIDSPNEIRRAEDPTWEYRPAQMRSDLFDAGTVAGSADGELGAGTGHRPGDAGDGSSKACVVM